MRLDQAGRIMLGDREVSRVYLGANMVWQKFSPASLFAQGEQGAWYDPSDFSTLFQDSAGTVPVTAVGQPVGLMLDKSKGLALGPELLPSLNFNLWTARSGGTNTVLSKNSFSVTTEGGRSIAFVVRVGMCYEITFQATSSGPVASFHNSTNVGTNRRATVDGSLQTVRFVAVTADIGFRLASAGTLTVDNISVRELLGSHASQPTATARPIYRASPARIDFDTVDDVLVTTFPASLGSSCTVARAVPGVGAQILTGQTVGTTFSDTTDHAGLVIINRALTPSETTALTAYLTAKVAA